VENGNHRVELVFLKLGGSLITDKTRAETPRLAVIDRLASEVAAALAARPGLRLVLGHGSGSYGHMMGQRFGTRQGVRSPAEWRGFALTATAAQRLNRLVVDGLWRAGVEVWSLQPSSSALCCDGELIALEHRPISGALDQGLVPLVYGDVALDEVRGGTIISTEEVFAWLARRLNPDRIVLAGVVPGVVRSCLSAGDGEEAIAEITPARLAELSIHLGGSHGTDVTGGMLSKVRAMCALVEECTALQVRLVSGQVAGLVREVLCDATLAVGTLIRAGRPC
jgi:isopentenyl phosphate kinase